MRILITGGSGFIGTNFIEKIKLNNNEILNIDIKKPNIIEHHKYWLKCNILDKSYLNNVITQWNPDYVLHLAANTSTEGNSLEDYKENTVGVENLLSILAGLESIKKIIITSSQYVHQKNEQPISDTDFFPYTVYGESKKITELKVRNYSNQLPWTIIRPVNIWGPYSEVYAENLWRIMNEGLYVHPGKQKVIRSYGYVGNVVDQIYKLFYIEPELTNEQVYYVGDKPINLLELVNKFSNAINGNNIKIVPRIIIKILAEFGAVLAKINVNFPMNRNRYENMIYDNPAPMEKTFALLGKPQISIDEGVEKSINWYKNVYLEDR
ncbi:MAG TPA: NAD(P)-dependent oxidoreductase [Bacteroidales bacterium]|nr:NAD(P)-dependent oxidoreductase [Bacteroidales bacterium]